MCLAIPGKVVKINKKEVLIDYLGEKRKAVLQDLKIKKGDYVLVQAGFVVHKLDKKQALESLKAIQSI